MDNLLLATYCIVVAVSRRLERRRMLATGSLAVGFAASLWLTYRTMPSA